MWCVKYKTLKATLLPDVGAFMLPHCLEWNSNSLRCLMACLCYLTATAPQSETTLHLYNLVSIGLCMALSLNPVLMYQSQLKETAEVPLMQGRYKHLPDRLAKEAGGHTRRQEVCT